MKLLGIPIKIEPSFFVLSVFLASSRGLQPLLLLEWAVVVFISVLLHELGHALVGRRFGLSPQITLYSMGGLTSWGDAKQIAPPKDLAISLAGPAAGFLFGAVLYLAGPTLLSAAPSELLTVAYRDLLWVNIGWGIFNLFPILPLDGGHVLSTLERWITKKQDQIISHTISLLLSLTVTFIAFTSGFRWIAILGIWFAYSNAAYLIDRIKRTRDKKLEGKHKEAYTAVNEGKHDEAIETIAEIQKKAQTQWMQSEAKRLLIFSLIKQKRYNEADVELRKFYGLFGQDHMLQGYLSFEKNEMSQAIPDLKIAFAQMPDYQLGLMLSQALMAEKRYAEVLELIRHDAMADAIWQLSINLHNDAFENHEFEISGKAGALAYEQKPDQNTAYNAACAFARASDSAQAFVWLERAIASGFNDKNLLTTDEDLESIRSHPGFDDIVKRLS